MEKVDWSKAPDDATHCWPNAPEFFKCERGVWLVWCMNAQQWHKAELESRILGLIPRPRQAWTGTGLPPVGTHVEMANEQCYGLSEYGSKFIGQNCVVRSLFVNSLGSDMVAVEKDDGACCCFLADMCRPIKTQAQIAAEEREAAIEELRILLSEVSCDDYHAAVAMIDAGYRKSTPTQEDK